MIVDDNIFDNTLNFKNNTNNYNTSSLFTFISPKPIIISRQENNNLLQPSFKDYFNSIFSKNTALVPLQNHQNTIKFQNKFCNKVWNIKISDCHYWKERWCSLKGKIDRNGLLNAILVNLQEVMLELAAWN